MEDMCGYEEMTQAPEPMELRHVEGPTTSPPDTRDYYFTGLSGSDKAIMGGEWHKYWEERVLFSLLWLLSFGLFCQMF